MIGVLFGMGAAIVALVVIVAYLAGRIADLVDSNEVQHAKCTAHISDVTSSRITGMAIRHLAERLDSVDSRTDLNRLRYEHKDGGPSITARWLLEQAERIDPQQPPRLHIPSDGYVRLDGTEIFTTEQDD